jgi:hypothetical protein
MPKQVRHGSNVILNSFQNPISEFDIHLTFACLREAPPPEALRRAGASAKAGILKFEL